MDPTRAELTAKLSTWHIRVSDQRIKVLAFLLKNRCHPTAEQIYRALQDELPSLSKTTIYNTLTALAKAGLVRVLTIEDNEARFDIVTANHGHFKCESCGAIYNFTIDVDSIAPPELSRFQINERNVFFNGLCPNCRSTIQKENEGG